METLTDNAAFFRGWKASEDWTMPHLNPYPQMSEDWFSWQRGFDQGNQALLEPH